MRFLNKNGKAAGKVTLAASLLLCEDKAHMFNLRHLKRERERDIYKLTIVALHTRLQVTRSNAKGPCPL